MSQNYDFKNLSPIDFEELCRDLLQKELCITLESFTEGKDGGIDFRYAQGVDKLIFQCKRFTKDSFSSLETELKKELSKVKKLNPTRYIVMTSFGLTPANKQIILNLFSPYIVSISDIYGKNDINNLLGKFEDVEKKHYKLWFNSTSILTYLLHSGSYNRSTDKLQKIQNKLKIYVLNESYNNAVDILNKNNYCVISGVPGIGKTTLADILSFQYIQQEFEFLFISNNISEAWGLLKKDTKQLFYFDDFLGRNFLEDRLEKNEDDSLISFIEYVKKDKSKKFILTTREYILNQAKHTYKKLDNGGLELAKCTLDLGNYTKLIKAKIFYNHLFYSDLELEYINALLKDKTYQTIIEHQNYNPRLIEYITKKDIEQLVSDDEYPTYVISKFDNPESIWEEAFEKLSNSAKCVLYELAISSNEILLDELKSAFHKFYKTMAKEYNFSTTPSDFDSAIKELDNNFTKITMDDGKQSIVSFHNPSIRDFIISLINNSTSIKEMLIDNLLYFNQAFYAFRNPNETTEHIFDKHKINIDNDLEKKLALKSIELTNDIKTTSIKIIYASDNKKVMKPNTPNISAQLWMLHNRFVSSSEIQSFIIETLKNVNLKEIFITSGQDKPSLIALIDKYNIKSKEKVIFELLDYLKENNIDYDEDIECLLYCKDTILGFDEYFKDNEDYFIDCIESYADSVAQAIDKHYDGAEIINILNEFNESFGCNIDYEHLHERADEMGHNRDDYDLWRETSREQKFDRELEDRYIDSIFGTLISDK
ncbi:MAG: restriction endonuclease [Sulfurimonas sp.]|uniref:nSTAND3 domain-containing NTPase n=1 Tax=Sulfurimonas sp. TaxID=2022749 RepID=UPI0025D51444|nr:restriction endonuclease [Sulfurimonas sp.]MCK9454370.1 restriction endonuclease [Sulfurimonas sp.]